PAAAPAALPLLSLHDALPIFQTPNMDRLMQGGVSFSRTYATSPLCTPSRGSMLTGDYAFTHGMGTNCDMYHALGRELANPERLRSEEHTSELQSRENIVCRLR